MFAGSPEPIGHVAAAAVRANVATVTAAWPTGLAHLGMGAVDCARYDGDVAARGDAAPAFRPCAMDLSPRKRG